MRLSRTCSPLLKLDTVSSILFLQKQLLKNCLRQRVWLGYIFLFEFMLTIQYYFQMKYSIIADKSFNSPPILLNGDYNWLASNYNGTIALRVTSQNLLKINSVSYVKEQSAEQSIRRQKNVEFILKDHINFAHLKYVCQYDEEWILILEKPFRIYIGLKKYEKLVPILLPIELEIEFFSCNLSYPDLTIYGNSTGKNKNLMNVLNLQTFQIKEITNAKDYQPSSRVNFWSYYSDSRFYVVGGVNKEGKPLDRLLWTYNMENGYWFALDTNIPQDLKLDSSLSCQYQSGKVLVIGNQQLYVIELYQSKITKIDDQSKTFSSQVVKKIKGMYVYQGWIYFLVQNSLLAERFKINKIKQSH